jgi:hypothetical protein
MDGTPTGHITDAHVRRPSLSIFLKRQRTDGELRGYPTIYLGPSSLCHQGHQVMARTTNEVVTSNDLIHGKHYQWVTGHEDEKLSATNRPPQTCRYDDDIRKIEYSNRTGLGTEYRDWEYFGKEHAAETESDSRDNATRREGKGNTDRTAKTGERRE